MRPLWSTEPPVGRGFATLPAVLAPVTRTLILMSILWNFNAFTQFHVMLGRDPGLHADVPSTLIMREAFQSFNFGVGSAMSFALMAFTLVFTIIYLRMLQPREDRRGRK